MRKGDMDLLRRIEAGAIDANTSISDLLRMCVVLGEHTGSPELRKWALQELNGYGEEDELPSYRKLNASLKMNGFIAGMQTSGLTMPLSEVPAEIREQGWDNILPLRMSIKEIEDTAQRQADKSEDAHFMSLGTMELTKYMTKYGRRVTSLYWAVSSSALTGVVDQVRTLLAMFVSQLRAATPALGRKPTAAATTAAFQNAQIGSVSIYTGDGNAPWWQRTGVLLTAASVLFAAVSTLAALGWLS